MKLPRPLSAGLLVAAFALLASACGGTKSPEGWAAPLDQDAMVYFFPEKDRVTAVTLEGGVATEEWTFPAPNRESDEDLDFKAVYDAVLGDGVLYFGSWNGRVLALDAETGELVWTLKDEIQGGIVGGPVYADGRVFFGTTDGRLYVRDAKSGATSGSWPDDGVGFGEGIWAAPVIAGDLVVVATMGGKVHAFDIESGDAAWDEPFETSGAIADLALLDESTLFVPSLNKRLYALNVADGTEKAEPFQAKDWIWTRPAVAPAQGGNGAVVYFGDFAGRIYALDITTWEEVWADGPYESGARVKAAPAVIGETLVVATRDPEVHFLERETGRLLNSVPIDSGTVRASLLAHGDVVVIATTEGDLFVANPENYSVARVALAGGRS